MSENELYHYGVLGMKWGVRRQAKMLAKAEKKLGRKVTDDDFAGPITNRGIRKVKKYDELEAAYKKVKRKKDPSFDYVHGFDIRTQNVLSDRKIKRIIKKMEKDPSTNVLKELERSHNVQRGEEIAKRILMSGLGVASTAAVNAIIADRLSGH